MLNNNIFVNPFNRIKTLILRITIKNNFIKSLFNSAIIYYIYIISYFFKAINLFAITISVFLYSYFPFNNIIYLFNQALYLRSPKLKVDNFNIIYIKELNISFLKLSSIIILNNF